MNLVDVLFDYQDSSEPAYLTLECRLGNPPSVCGVTKYGTVSEITINKEKPKQSYFYINYLGEFAGGGVRFKASPHEVKMIVDIYGNIVYISENELVKKD